MFTPAVQRVVWKEFRAQRAVWIAIAVEMVLLQFWWAIAQNRYVEINLFSVAFVLTGVFAMTSSALLFAGESEAQTDGFLRQLPFRSREVLLGKISYSMAAVLTFLALGTVTTLIAATIAGRFGGEADSSILGEPLVFVNGIAGLWAWGLFYSLVTRRVIWTVIGASATELLVNGVIHGIIGEYRLSDVVIYSTYWTVVLGVFSVDAWLLSKWYTRDASVGTIRSLGLASSNAATSAEVPPLPWLSTYRFCSLTGIVGGILLIVQLVILSDNAQPIHFRLLLTLLSLSLFLAAAIVKAMSLVWPQLTAGPHGTEIAPHQISQRKAPLSLQRVFDFLNLLGTGLVSLIIGGIASYSGIALIANIITVVRYQWSGPSIPPPISEFGILLLLSIGSSLGLYIGDATIRNLTGQPTSGWVQLLQKLQSTCRRVGHGWGSLIWIEARRALPVVVVGLIYLNVVLGLSSRTSVDPSTPFFNLGFISLICGLMTLLPDRSHGSLAFLHERGISARSILVSKLLVWGTALALVVVIPLANCAQLWNNIQLNSITLTPLTLPGMSVPVMLNTSRFGGVLLTLFGISGGMFVIGFLCAAWIRRPILAVLGGITGTIIWGAWLGTLTGLVALSDSRVLFPVFLLAVGVFWNGSSSLLEQANWKSRLGRVGWVLLVTAVSLQSLFRYRANEIPLVNVPVNMRGGQPSPTGGKIASSWPPVMSEDAFDQLGEPGPQQNALIQPQGFWGSENLFRTMIQRLHLGDETCDLGASIAHLHKWLRVVNQMSRNSRNEDGWVECLKSQRVLLSAVRRWSNHPLQTVQQLDAAVEELSQLEFVAGNYAINREYADALRALEQGIPMDSRQSQQEPFSFYRLFLTLSGEKQRVRRLVDYYYNLSGNSHVAEDPNLGQQYYQWLSTTAPSAYAFGVHLPPRTFADRHRGQMEMSMSATRATALVLRLQSWRLKHGQFPASLASLLQPGETATDLLTMSDYGYEPQGFDRKLRINGEQAVQAGQPLLYSLGVNQPRGVALQNRAGDSGPFYVTLNWSTGSFPGLNAEQLRGLSQSSLMGIDIMNFEGPVDPNQLRFVILGQKVTEDSLDLLPKESVPQLPVEEGSEQGAAMGMGPSMMSGSGGEGTEMSGDLAPPSLEPAISGPASDSGTTPPAPPESQPVESKPL